MSIEFLMNAVMITGGNRWAVSPTELVQFQQNRVTGSNKLRKRLYSVSVRKTLSETPNISALCSQNATRVCKALSLNLQSRPLVCKSSHKTCHDL